MAQQIWRAALSVHLNIAEGCFLKSKAQRNCFFEMARRSVSEIDTVLGIAHQLSYASLEALQLTGDKIINTFK